MDLCELCLEDFNFITNPCNICSVELATNKNQFCAVCLNTDRPYNKIFCAFTYDFPISYMITNLKFHAKFLCAKLLGLLMKDYILNVWYKDKNLPACIIPVPLHFKRLKIRGYNQAYEIAKTIKKYLPKIVIDTKSFIRVKNTKEQTSLKLNKRFSNLKNAFSITKYGEKFVRKYRHVAILDDVVTTQSTIKEFAKILKKNGVEIIDVWCCARAHMDFKQE